MAQPVNQLDHKPQRILLIRPSALGDVCRTVPLVVSLRRAYSDAHIDWLVQDSFAGAIAAHPALSSVVAFPRRELGKASKHGNLLPAMKWMRAHLTGRYDLVIDAQGLLRSAIFARATKAPRRIGHADAREGATLLYTHRVPSTATHTVDRMLELLPAAGAAPIADMQLYAPDADMHTAANEAPEGAVVLAPTSRWPAKRWPAERFAELTTRLLDAGAKAVVIVGGNSERDQIAPVLQLAEADDRVIDLVGRTSISSLLAHIARATLVIANDSAAAHIAVGFDRPLVALYGPTDVAKVGPYRREADVIQHVKPGDKLTHKDDATVELMQRISTDEVFAAAIARF